jgi:hypothetical protein
VCTHDARTSVLRSPLAAHPSVMRTSVMSLHRQNVELDTDIASG